MDSRFNILRFNIISLGNVSCHEILNETLDEILNELLNKMVAFVHETLFNILNKTLLKTILNLGSPIHLQPFVEEFIKNLKAKILGVKALETLE